VRQLEHAWYLLEFVGAYDYSSDFNEKRLGESANGFLCGSELNGGKHSNFDEHGGCGGS
jgi:hypothetical protein